MVCCLETSANWMAGRSQACLRPPSVLRDFEVLVLTLSMFAVDAQPGPVSLSCSSGVSLWLKLTLLTAWWSNGDNWPDGGEMCARSGMCRVSL